MRTRKTANADSVSAAAAPVAAAEIKMPLVPCEDSPPNISRMTTTTMANTRQGYFQPLGEDLRNQGPE
jgi:hypothetical protein